MASPSKQQPVASTPAEAVTEPIAPRIMPVTPIDSKLSSSAAGNLESSAFDPSLTADRDSESISALHRTLQRAAYNFGELCQRMSEFAVRTRDAARTMKEEDPLKALGMIAGTAFALGVVLRIWRSSRS